MQLASPLVSVQHRRFIDLLINTLALSVVFGEACLCHSYNTTVGVLEVGMVDSIPVLVVRMAGRVGTEVPADNNIHCWVDTVAAEPVDNTVDLE